MFWIYENGDSKTSNRRNVHGNVEITVRLRFYNKTEAENTQIKITEVMPVAGDGVEVYVNWEWLSG